MGYSIEEFLLVCEGGEKRGKTSPESDESRKKKFQLMDGLGSRRGWVTADVFFWALHRTVSRPWWW
jgi:hypothetical protein